MHSITYLLKRLLFRQYLLDTNEMRSSHDSYSSSSSSLRNSKYSSPSHSLDIGLTPFSGSDRAEFRDRYQNKVKLKKK